MRRSFAHLCRKMIHMDCANFRASKIWTNIEKSASNRGYWSTFSISLFHFSHLFFSANGSYHERTVAKKIQNFASFEKMRRRHNSAILSLLDVKRTRRERVSSQTEVAFLQHAQRRAHIFFVLTVAGAVDFADEEERERMMMAFLAHKCRINAMLRKLSTAFSLCTAVKGQEPGGNEHHADTSAFA